MTGRRKRKVRKGRRREGRRDGGRPHRGREKENTSERWQERRTKRKETSLFVAGELDPGGQATVTGRQKHWSFLF